LQQRTYLMRLGGLLAGGMVFVSIYRLCIAMVSYLHIVVPNLPAAGALSIMAVGTILGTIVAINTVMRVRRSSLTEGPKPESLVRLSRATTFVVGYAVTAIAFATALAWIESISPDSLLANAARVGATVLVGTILPDLVACLLSNSMGNDKGATPKP
jgi:hypothetical protein